MSKLNTIEKVVLEALEEYPSTRKDDYLLMYFVCSKLCKQIFSHPFGYVLLEHKELKLPNWKSIERARRKIQAKRPDLKDSETAKIRAEEEEVYIEYAREA